MEQLCEMAYFGQHNCEELWITEPGSFENIWKRYDAYEPMVNLDLKRLYIRYECVCSGFWSFMREVFPNCQVVIYE